MQGLYIAVAILLLIVLYHVIFVIVDLRKIVRRIEGITQEVEAVILKPLSMTDKALEWVNGFIESKTRKHEKKHHTERSKHFESTEV